MKAMILAAGLGTRLRPLTNERPKALIEINGRTLLQITIERLRTFGVTDIIVNVHHFADKICDYLKSLYNFGVRVEISREDDLLLDTGGGLKKASWFFLKENATHSPVTSDEPFVLHNVDVLTNIDLTAMLEFHRKRDALATLAVQQRHTSRPLAFDSQGQLIARAVGSSRERSVILSEAKDHGEVQGQSTNAETTPFTSAGLRVFAFSGVHIISPRLLPLLTESGPFSIIDSYIRLAANHKILAFPADQYYWRDLGRPADLEQAAQDLSQGLI